MIVSSIDSSSKMYYRAIGFVLFLSLILSISPEKVADPLVDVPKYGKLEGSIRHSENGTEYYAFEGVPFANPPVGEYRFKEPQALQPWQGIKEAKTVTACVQYRHLNVKPNPEEPFYGSEDCLHLNIYTPTIDVDANLDVIVYFHGGAFMFNYGAFQKPDFLLNNRVVYINLNYRLGPMGFLSTEDDVVPGNNGLKDQIAALRWIKDNIRYFGGNPESITITGNSAGGASVHLHYLMQQSRGLFNKGVSQSGCALNAWVISEKPLSKTQKIAANLNCPTSNTTKMMECLRQASARSIVEAVKLFQPFLYNPFTPFGVVVDTWASEPLLPKHPYRLLKDKEVYDVPWLASHCNSEGLYPAAEFYSQEQYIPYINQNWDDVVQHIMHFNNTIAPDKMKEVTQMIRRKYLGDRELTRETFDDFVQAVGDRLFVVDIQKAIKLHANAVTSSVYFYYFSYRGQHSRSDTRSESTRDFGASHADDLSYIFNMKLATRDNPKDKAMSEFLIKKIWLSYAHRGVPDVSPSRWKTVSKSPVDKLFTIRSLNQMKMEKFANLGQADFWNSLPFNENENFNDSLYRTK